MVDASQVAAAGVLGGLLTLERRAFLQAMLSRPLAAATLVGGAMGDVTSGLYIGMLLELLHLGTASLGAALPQHDTLVATGTAACAAGLAATGGGGTAAQWSLSVLLFAGLGRLGRIIDRRLDRYASRVARRALESAESGDLARAMRQNLWAMWPTFVVFGALTALCGCVGFLCGPFVRQLPAPLLRGLAWGYPAMASVAAAMAAKGSHSRKAALYAGVAAGVAGVAAFAVEWLGWGGEA